MRKIYLLLLALVLSPLASAATEVRAIRSWSAPDQTRLVFDISSPLEHQLFTLDSPDRLVVDLKQSRFSGKAPTPAGSDRFIQRMRTGIRKGSDLRVVLDLKQPVKFKSFLLEPNEQYGHRLVVDVEARNPDATSKTVTTGKVASASSKAEGPAAAAPVVAKSLPSAGDGGRDLIIAIDAGHGGEDPGAIGRKGTREKDVVLSIARRLKKVVDAEPGMKGVLIRSGDYYIPLRKRMALARKHKADFFVSIHADAFRDRRARGSSVYVLSRKGASSEAARWLAQKENAADFVGGVSLDDKDDVLASVLLDLSQTASMQASHDAAEQVLRNLKSLGRVHSSKVQQARFVVLKSPDIPSMLVETAFISNPAEEKKLRSAAHQEKVAKAILGGIRDYFRRDPPPDTWLAMNERARPRTHVCEAGDTLSEIANRYGTSLAGLRRHNGLKSDRIRVGQVLKIPLDT
jgi:N-acetylmuramoyl-L-alanine amidase